MTALQAVNPPIAHRDIKPNNIFLDGAGAARVADMNLSVRMHDSSLASLTGETGTYLYMSPEMMRHEVCHLSFVGYSDDAAPCRHAGRMQHMSTMVSTICHRHNANIAARQCAAYLTAWQQRHHETSCLQIYSCKTDIWSWAVMLVELCNHALPYSNLYLTPLQVAMGVADGRLTPSLQSSGYPNALLALVEACLQHDAGLRPLFVHIVPRMRSIIAEVVQFEGRAEAAQQGTLIGRMSGMLQGAASHAAMGLQREATRVWSQSGHNGGVDAYVAMPCAPLPEAQMPCSTVPCPQHPQLRLMAKHGSKPPPPQVQGDVYVGLAGHGRDAPHQGTPALWRHSQVPPRARDMGNAAKSLFQGFIRRASGER